MKHVPGIVAAFLIAACASAPAEPPARPTPGIVVTPLERGRLMGGRAVYTVAAPADRVLAELLDFEAQAGYRPTVVESRLVQATPEGGEVFFRFRGAYGVEPPATCLYTVERTGDGAAVAFAMTGSSLALWALEGSFRLRRIDDGRTRVEQEFLVSALVLDREGLLADLRSDAAAIQEHVERVAAE